MIQSISKKFSSQMKLYLKIGFILFLILLLMIPNAMISSLINERSSLQYQVKREIAHSWGGDQDMMGPLLSIPYTYKLSDATDATLYEKKMYFTPESQEIDVVASTEERQKGIYSTTLFTSDNKIKSTFKKPSQEVFGSMVHEIKWKDAELMLPITQPRTIQSSVSADVNGKTIKMRSFNMDGIQGVKLTVDVTDMDEISFATSILKRGSQYLNFVPTGGETNINIQSDWPSPGFSGVSSPLSRDITASGFAANWTANEYSRPMPAYWKDGEYRLNMNEGKFGVQLVKTVDHYQKNTRSVKYALLIIGLSFLTFFFFEITKGNRVHPVQYILIGLALSLFYLLLLSFTEHVGFNMAYGIATVATVLLITWYSSSVLAKGKGALLLGGILASLYGYIFVLLQMEDYALLAGAVGLFVILAGVMALSKKFNWYDY